MTTKRKKEKVLDAGWIEWIKGLPTRELYRMEGAAYAVLNAEYEDEQDDDNPPLEVRVLHAKVRYIQKVIETRRRESGGEPLRETYADEWDRCASEWSSLYMFMQGDEIDGALRTIEVLREELETLYEAMV